MVVKCRVVVPLPPRKNMPPPRFFARLLLMVQFHMVRSPDPIFSIPPPRQALLLLKVEALISPRAVPVIDRPPPPEVNPPPQFEYWSFELPSTRRWSNS